MVLYIRDKTILEDTKSRTILQVGHNFLNTVSWRYDEISVLFRVAYSADVCFLESEVVDRIANHLFHGCVTTSYVERLFTCFEHIIH